MTDACSRLPRPRARSLALSALFAWLGCKAEAPGDAAAVAPSPASTTAAPPGAPAPAAAADPAALPDAEAVLARAAEAIGSAKLAGLKSYHSAGKLEIAGQNIEGSLRTWWKEGDFYSESDVLGVGKVRAGKKADVIWSDDPVQGLRRLHGREAEQAAWQASLSLASQWKTFFANARTLGRRQAGDRSLIDVELGTSSGDKVTIAFDEASGLPIEQRFAQVGPQGTIPIRLELLDYREVSGVKFSFRQVADMSLLSMTTEITDLQLDVPVDESRFPMPASPAGVPAPSPAPGATAGAAAPAAPPPSAPSP